MRETQVRFLASLYLDMPCMVWEPHAMRRLNESDFPFLDFTIPGPHFNSPVEYNVFWLCLTLGFNYADVLRQATSWGGLHEVYDNLSWYSVPWPQNVRRCANCRDPVPGCRCGIHALQGALWTPWEQVRKTPFLPRRT